MKFIEKSKKIMRLETSDTSLRPNQSKWFKRNAIKGPKTATRIIREEQSQIPNFRESLKSIIPDSLNITYCLQRDILFLLPFI